MAEEILKRECFVAVIDILGFGEIVKKNKLEDVVSLYKEFKDNCESYFKDMPVLKEAMKIDAGELEVKIFSDTLILYTVDLKPKNPELILREFHYFLYGIKFLYQTALKYELLLRGATAFGEVYADGDVLIGEPIVEAHDREKQQTWSGCWVSKKCCKKVFISPEILQDFIVMNGAHDLLVKYSIPVKEGKDVPEEYALNWVREVFFREKIIGYLKKEIEKVKDIKEKNIKEKLDNTMKFVELIDNLETPAFE